ncbi:type VII secretion-associated protein [Corynebacterium lactis]|uniref:Type VII secretion-associated protein n=1 Tax=Corynebacterium lactis RW2-5 TaxID=1408189 RepID=A0A0K2H2X4_9CORY|nr:type VII secretion-associated protein [Corynebacterium lactis]ALA68400.1 hypothetical protein CLAC_02185 [Corynebacterium lactis RW2-5]
MDSLDTLREGTWHLWGMAAVGLNHQFTPTPDARRSLLQSIHTVVIPSYWALPRQRKLAQKLIDQGINPVIVKLADAVSELEPPSVAHSIIVEVEKERVCVTRTTGPRRVSRLIHTVGGGEGAALVETVIAVAYQLTASPDDPSGVPDPVEVNGGRGVTEYPKKWVDSVEFIVAETPPGYPVLRRQPLVDRLRSRGFLSFVVPCESLADSPMPTPTPRPAEPTPDFGGVPSGSEEPSQKAQVAVAIGVLAVSVVVLAGLIWAIPHMGARDAEGSFPPAPSESRSVHAQPSVASPPPPKPQDPAPIDVDIEFAGVALSLPGGWQRDDTSPRDRLIAVNGGDMRVVAQSYPLSDGASLEHIVAGLTSHSEVDATMSIPVRSQLYGIDMVTLQERPPSGQSVVLWHHKIIDGVQVSVGCQFRGSDIPRQRPACEKAVQSAIPAL